MQDETTSSQSPQTSETETLQLTPKQLKFVCVYAMNGGNGAQAAIAAGYSPKAAKEIAHENLTKPHIQRALAAITHDEVYTTKRLLELMGAQALDTDMADFWPFLAGEKTLPELRDSGISTKLVRKVTMRTRTRTDRTKDGCEVTTTDEVRGIELYDAQAAARDLLRIRTAAGEDSANEPMPAPPVVNVTLVQELRRQLAKAHDEPFVPGIPRLDGDRPLPDGGSSGSGEDDNGIGDAPEGE